MTPHPTACDGSAAPEGAGTAAGDTARTCRETRDLLWAAVGRRDEQAAARAVFDALEAGVTTEQVLLDVIAPVQAKVGEEWAAARIGVAQEHAATAIHERVIAAIGLRAVPPGSAGRGRVAVACVDGEWHALPARILAEVLRSRGFTVDFLGAQVPTPHLIAHLHQTGPDIVALSSSLPTRLPAAHAAVSAVQAIGLPVVAGGAAFGPDGRYARLLGADGWARDARDAARVIGRTLHGGDRTAFHQPIDDLPHLADQEYTLISRGRPELVRTTLRGLEERVPAVRSYTDRQRERTSEDLAHIVDFLAVSLYTDDRALFGGFLGWTGDILEARGVPAAVLLPGLELLAEELKDFPRALRHLAHGRATVAARPKAASGHHV
ncbi:B12-binding domain-containing protein [Streptomyces sp. t39]|uniref:cobalamin B12-binding domain-containing protein n=1 Tax=Streptomyces sp. t39 TaxID=1828156 RepID=UPI0011CE16AB|nr:cobalamin-dependent protein [Streptomyces sp. t39]TXS52402.1 cobalamin-binding protein [Streptomyces sp. t39]